MGVYKDKQGYYFKVCVDNHQYKSKRFKSSPDAKKAEAKYLLTEKNPDKKNFNIVAEEYFDYIKTINKESSVRASYYGYEKYLKEFFNCDISKINQIKIKKWGSYMNGLPLSVSSKNKAYSTLKNILDYGVKFYNLARNEASIYGRFKRKQDEEHVEHLKYITLEEFNKFISVIDEELWECFFTTLFFTGCRKSELFALKWSDVDFKNNEIRITKTITRGFSGDYVSSTKTNKNRTIKMNQRLRDALERHLIDEQKHIDFNYGWYVFGDYEPMARSTADRAKHKYFVLSGVHEITMHEFRHSCVSLLINEYVKINNEKGIKSDTAKFFLMLSNRMGHSVEVMTKTYLHLFPSIQDEIVDLLDNL